MVEWVDWHREAFYGFERAARVKFDRAWPNALSIMECRLLADSAFSLCRRWPDLPFRIVPTHKIRCGRVTCTYEVGPSSIGFGYGVVGGRYLVTLPYCRRRGWTVLHEVAHVLTWGSGHGPAFAELTIDLWVNLLDWPRDELLAIADSYGVTVDA